MAQQTDDPIDLEKYRSIGVLRPGYKNAKRKVVKDRSGSHQTEHFSGRVDATVVVKPVKVKATPTKFQER